MENVWELVEHSLLFIQLIAAGILVIFLMWMIDVFSIANKIGVYNMQIIKNIINQRDPVVTQGEEKDPFN